MKTTAFRSIVLIGYQDLQINLSSLADRVTYSPYPYIFLSLHRQIYANSEE